MSGPHEVSNAKVWWQPVAGLPLEAVPLSEAPDAFAAPALAAKQRRAVNAHPGAKWIPGPPDERGRRVPPFVLAKESEIAIANYDAAVVALRDSILDRLAEG